MASADDLKATVAEMRALGITRLKTPELEVDLGPAVIEAAKPPQNVEEVDEESKAATRDEREWNTRWRKLLRSSGSPVPPFPKTRFAVMK